MPVYTYVCENCGNRFDARQSFSDASLTVCPTCEGKIRRVIQPAVVVFKGSGFYVTDSRSKQNLATNGSKKDDAKVAENGSHDNGSHDNGSSSGDGNSGNESGKSNEGKGEKAEAKPAASTETNTVTHTATTKATSPAE